MRLLEVAGGSTPRATPAAVRIGGELWPSLPKAGLNHVPIFTLRRAPS